MDHTTLIINRVLPIFLLIGLGYGLRRTQFLPEQTIADLRKLVVNLALPAVLFLSFLQMELQLSYVLIFAAIFLLCVALYVLGVQAARRFGFNHPYFPFLMTGFEYGMLGVSLFGGAYGLDKIGYIAVMDLGHELFIWFVFLALLLRKRDGLQSTAQIVGSFFRSPVILGVLAGIALNVLGARQFLYEGPIVGGVISALGFLSNMTIPLILIIVGYGIRLDSRGLRDALPVIGIRLAVVIPVAFALNLILIRTVLNLPYAFEVALFTLLILPPPFIIPLYMKADTGEQREYVNNVLTLYTVVSIAIFTIYFIANPVI
ncbi:MAG: AEC family transporter [Anaerolineae bacterium]|nr:AEC family transporter [Anaerolineae bacterium]